MSFDLFTLGRKRKILREKSVQYRVIVLFWHLVFVIINKKFHESFY